MASRWIELLAPGTYRLSDGRTLAVSPADVRNAAAAGGRMLAAGLRVPCCWSHVPLAQPAYLGHLPPGVNPARDYYGQVRRYAVRGGTLRALVDVPRPVDLEQFELVNGVSPRVQRDWIDERGVVWPGLTVGHVAATPTPIQRGLRPPADLAHVAGTVPGTFDLAHATREPPAMSDTDSDAPPSAANDTGPVRSILDSLAALGVDLGDGVVTDLASLDMALKVAVSVKGASDPDADDLPPEDSPADDGGTVAGPMPPALMGHFSRLAKAEAKDLARRVDRLFTTHRIDGKLRDRLHAELKAADLSHDSFAADGALKAMPVTARIDAYEQLPAGRLSAEHRKPADLSHTADAPPPDSKSEADEIVRRQEELAKKYSAKPAAR